MRRSEEEITSISVLMEAGEAKKRGTVSTNQRRGKPQLPYTRVWGEEEVP